MVRGSRSAILLVFKLVLTLVALWFVISTIELERFLTIIQRANLFWMALAFFLAVADLILVSWRWKLVHLLFSPIPLSFAPSLIGMGRGLWMGQLLPSTVGTDAIRLASIVKQAGFGNALRSVAADRFVGLATLVILVLLLLPLSVRYIADPEAAASLYVLAFGGVLAFGLFLFAPGLIVWIPFVGKIAADVVTTLRAVMFSRSGLLIIPLSILVHVLSVMFFAAFAYSVGGRISLFIALLIVPPAMLVAAIPISFGGWGIREAIFASAFTFVGADPVTGITASILFGLSTPAGGLVIEIIGRVIELLTGPDPIGGAELTKRSG